MKSEIWNLQILNLYLTKVIGFFCNFEPYFKKIRIPDFNRFVLI